MDPVLTHEEGWRDVAPIAAFDATDVFAVDVGRRRIALYQVGADVYATDDVCSHGDASLCEGFLEGHEIECPRHQGRFDVRTGEPTGAPANEAIDTWPVRIADGRLWLKVN